MGEVGRKGIITKWTGNCGRRSELQEEGGHGTIAPSVSHLTTPTPEGGEMRDPGNELGGTEVGKCQFTAKRVRSYYPNLEKISFCAISDDPISRSAGQG